MQQVFGFCGKCFPISGEKTGKIRMGAKSSSRQLRNPMNLFGNRSLDLGIDHADTQHGRKQADQKYCCSKGRSPWEDTTG
jgi:hypothetical protein